MSTLSALSILSSTALLVASATAAPPIEVDVQRDGGLVRMRAAVPFDATPETVWEVLTDYEGQVRFIPGLTESRVISRNAGGSTVLQKGSVKILLLRFDYEIEYTTQETRPRLLISSVTRGTVKHLHSEYRLSTETGGTRLDYAGEAEPEGWLAPLLAPWAMRVQLERELEAFVQEVGHRRRDQGQP